MFWKLYQFIVSASLHPLLRSEMLTLWTLTATLCNHHSLYTSALTLTVHVQALLCVCMEYLSVLVRNCHLCSSTILVCPHQGRATKTA